VRDWFARLGGDEIIIVIERLALLSRAMLNHVVHKVATGLERVTLWLKRKREGNVINLPPLLKWERKHMGEGKGLQPCGGTHKKCAKPCFTPYLFYAFFA
jgi:hypothetical protein